MRTWQIYITQADHFDLCTAQEHSPIQESLKNRKTPGSDRVNNRLLKELSVKSG